MSEIDVVFVPVGLQARGGLTIDVEILANGLVQRGHRAAVLGVGGPGDTLPGLDGAVDVLRVDGARGVGRALHDRAGCIVHLFSVLPAAVPATALASARRIGAPTVWTTMVHPQRARVWRSPPWRRPMLAFDAVALRAVRLVDVAASATRAESSLLARMGARRVELLPPVVRDRALADRAAAAARRGDAPLVVIVCARDEPRKGLRFGFDTFVLVRRARPDARLVVVGMEGEDALATFTGRVSDAELALWLRAADVVFVPSLYEAFSRVTIEAWQQETPVVVTDGVGLAEDVATRGAVVPYGDADAAAAAILGLLDDPDTARRMGTAGAALVREHFTERALLDDAVEVYASLGRVHAGKSAR